MSVQEAAARVDPDRDQEADVEELLEGGSSEPENLLEFLASRPSRSVRNVDHADWFSPELGGWNRLALVLEEAANGKVVPMWGQVVLGLLEVAVARELIEVPSAFSSGSEEDGSDTSREELRRELGLTDDQEDDQGGEEREDLPGKP